ncbi:MAG: sulfotransferase [Candidatus Dormibacterales bacterium]
MRILYIAGAGRSGTTVVANALNEVPGYFHAGELQSLWSIAARGTLHTCGCGLEIRRCPVWSAVLGFPLSDGRSVAEAAPEAVRALETDRTPAALLRHVARPGGPRPPAYRRFAGLAYQAVAAVSGARVIVDSSKGPQDAASLTCIEGVEPFLVQVVRDPRAVAYSWLHPKAHLQRRGVVESTARWLQANRGADAVARLLPGRSLRVCYETFVSSPAPALRAILELLGDGDLSVPVEGTTLRLSGNHTLIGNPGRDTSGPVPLLLDRRWESGLPRWQALAISGATMPLMRRYGCRVKARGTAHGGRGGGGAS